MKETHSEAMRFAPYALLPLSKRFSECQAKNGCTEAGGVRVRILNIWLDPVRSLYSGPITPCPET